MTTDLAAHYEAVRSRLGDACRAAGRAPDDVTLVAVSKRHPDDAVRAVAALGQRDFGENIVQAWAARFEALGGLDLRWHLIGPIQTNKAKYVAHHPPALLHTIDRPPLALALARRLRAEAAEPPHGGVRHVGAPSQVDVLIQVNIDREPQKSGADPADVDALVDILAAEPQLRLCGLMCIPRPTAQAPPRPAFARLRALAERVGDRIAGTPILSMGMSADFEDAIAEGSTLIRIGTAIFGRRPG